MNVLAIDVESWLHKYFLDYDSLTKNNKDDGHICEAILKILKILEKHDVKTTFFVLSEIFDWYPWLIYKIRDMGHEIGFHTHTHRKLLRKKELLGELKKGKKFIDEFNTQGFRAPEVFIRKEYFPILRDWGFIYDSSIYSRFKIFEPIDGILEVPISTYPLLKTDTPIHYPRNLSIPLLLREIPFGSGYFIGLLGSNVQWFINQLNKKNVPTNIITHTWQIGNIPTTNRDMKGMQGNILNRIKMIPYNINRRDAINFLLQNNEFIPMIKLINIYHYDNENSDSKMNGGEIS